jgi:hypothetical protein
MRTIVVVTVPIVFPLKNLRYSVYDGTTFIAPVRVGRSPFRHLGRDRRGHRPALRATIGRGA